MAWMSWALNSRAQYRVVISGVMSCRMQRVDRADHDWVGHDRACRQASRPQAARAVEVLARHHRRAQRTFGGVVVHGQAGLLDEDCQPRPVVLHALQHLGRRLGQRGIGQRGVAIIGHALHRVAQLVIARFVGAAARLGLAALRVQVIQLADAPHPGDGPVLHAGVRVGQLQQVTPQMALQAALAHRANPS